MTKIVCAPKDRIPQRRSAAVVYISMYEQDGLPDVSTVGTSLIRHIVAAGISPNSVSWDFLTFALAVTAVDNLVKRSLSPDGWTRTIDVEILLHDPAPFEQLIPELQQMLRFLTGDFWKLTFSDDGYPPPIARKYVEYDADCVSLLSGGLDSLVGALDLTAQGKRPLFVSHVARGDTETQSLYAHTLGAADRHLQWNQNFRQKPADDGEGSTRGRSIVFFAFAAIAAEAISVSNANRIVDVFVPENGLISLNVPLNAGRVGSLSTKTTHPVLMQRLQSIWNMLEIPALLQLPYARVTKGEMMAQCLDQSRLKQLAGSSTSCGRFSVYGLMHCGRCVPCMVRRAAFTRSGIKDNTADYYYPDLASAQPEKLWEPNDVAAVATAVIKINKTGVRSFTAGQFAFAEAERRLEFERVVKLGFEELGTLLRYHKVL